MFIKSWQEHYEAFFHRGGNEKGCHATITKTVPRQRSGSCNSIEIPMQRRNVRMHAKDGGALPDTGCPMSWRQGNEWPIGHGANMSISNITSIRSRTSSRGYTFEACVIGVVRVRCGVGEVDVFGMFVVELVVLACSRVGGRGSRNLGDGSGTCLSLHEFL